MTAEDLKQDLQSRGQGAVAQQQLLCAGTDGLKWQDAGVTRPKGAELTNPKLADALTRKTHFTMEQWAAFGIENLQVDQYIKSGESYFKPTDGRELADNVSLDQQGVYRGAVIDLILLVFVRPADGRTIKVPLQPGMTAVALKGELQRRGEAPAEEIELLCSGKPFVDTTAVEEQVGYRPGEVIDLKTRGGQMVLVRPAEGPIIKVPLVPGMTASDLKKELQDRGQAPAERIQLLCAGKELDDAVPIEKQDGYHKGAPIDLVKKPEVILVRPAEGPIIEVPLVPGMTASDLKKELQGRGEAPAEQIQLLCAGKELEDAVPIEKQDGYTKDTPIDLVAKPEAFTADVMVNSEPVGQDKIRKKKVVADVIVESPAWEEEKVRKKKVVADAMVASPAWEDEEKRKKHRVSKPVAVTSPVAETTPVAVTTKKLEPTWLEKLINSGTEFANATERGVVKTADDTAHAVADVSEQVADVAGDVGSGIAENTKTAAEKVADAANDLGTGISDGTKTAARNVLGFPQWAVNLGTEANNEPEKNVENAAETVKSSSSSFFGGFGGFGGFFSPRAAPDDEPKEPAEPNDTFVDSGPVQEEARKKKKKLVSQETLEKSGAPADDRV
jgi:hypothetical protein